MAHTLTLRGLLFGVTILCALFALAAAFPDLTLRIASVIVLFFPAIHVSIVFAYWSPRPKVAFSIAILGAVVGWVLFSPTVHVSWIRPPSWWDIFLLTFTTQVIPTVIGAVAGGGIAIFVAASVRR